MKTKLNPLIIALIVFVIWVAIIMIGGELQPHGTGPEEIGASTARGINLNTAIAPLFLLVVVAVLGWRREVGLKRVEPARSLLVAWFPMLFILLFVAAAAAFGLSLTPAVAFVLINTLFVGISEELMFRGFILYGALTQFRVWAAIFFTCILFGSVHVLNGVMTGDFGGAAIQAIGAGISGFWFAAMRLRTKSIYPGMILHMLWDCGLFLIFVAVTQRHPEVTTAPPHETYSAMSVIRPLLYELPLFLYALWLLRGVGKKDKEELLS